MKEKDAGRREDGRDDELRLLAESMMQLPDELEFGYRNVICTDADAWSSLFKDGHGEVTFALLDPVAYGLARSETGTSFEVDGSWPTWPTFELVASAGSAVQVGCGAAFVRVEHASSDGEIVGIDCESEDVMIGGVDARADVALASDFFSLATGNRTLTFLGCAPHVTAFHERWLCWLALFLSSGGLTASTIASASCPWSTSSSTPRS